MGATAIGGKIPLELDAGFPAGRRSLPQDFQNDALFFWAVFRTVFDLQIKFDFWGTHERRVSAVFRIRESPSSKVRMGVLRCARAFELSRETSRGRTARPVDAPAG